MKFLSSYCQALVFAVSTLTIFGSGQSFAQQTSSPPPTYESLDSFFANPKTHRLSVRMTAKQMPVTIGGVTVQSNVYETCKVRTNTGSVLYCGLNTYGGPRLVLSQGDTLDVRLRNELPGMEETNGNGVTLPVENITNLHTHGLIVRAYAPNDHLADEPQSDSYGDYVFTGTMPVTATSNDCTMPMGHDHGGMPMNCGETRYEIKVPGHKHVSSLADGEHPSGTFWIHPHIHTLAKEQVSGGMTGMINIGTIRDYACVKPSADGTTCDKPLGFGIPMRHMLLKDIQVDLDATSSTTGTVRYDQDAGFCEGQEVANLDGFCEAKDANGTVIGKWFHTVNGVVYPTWSVPPGKAEIWRIQNASANVTYDLRIDGAGWTGDDDLGGMPFQVLGLDGVGLGLVDPAASGPAYDSAGTLQRRAILMPGSRIEIMVAWRDPATCDTTVTNPGFAACPASTPTGDQPMRLMAKDYDTGGDIWPKVGLAGVTLKGKPATPPPDAVVALLGNPQQIGGGFASADRVNPGEAFTNTATTEKCRSGKLRLLDPADGEMRRVYFGIVSDADKPGADTDPNWRPETFVLGHSIVNAAGDEYDEDGTPLPQGPWLRPMLMGDMKADLCVPFGTTETWELVNVSEEVHNFHIHQNKFAVERDADGNPVFRVQSNIDNVNLPSILLKAGLREVDHDTIIVPRGAGSGECGVDIGAGGHFEKNGTETAYRINAGSPCRGDGAAGDLSGMIRLSIPFLRRETLGQYVFHCHILEHEDLGMMSSIRVMSDDELNAP